MTHEPHVAVKLFNIKTAIVIGGFFPYIL